MFSGIPVRRILYQVGNTRVGGNQLPMWAAVVTQNEKNKSYFTPEPRTRLWCVGHGLRKHLSSSGAPSPHRSQIDNLGIDNKMTYPPPNPMAGGLHRDTVHSASNEHGCQRAQPPPSRKSAADTKKRTGMCHQNNKRPAHALQLTQ